MPCSRLTIFSILNQLVKSKPDAPKQLSWPPILCDIDETKFNQGFINLQYARTLIKKKNLQNIITDDSAQSAKSIFG